MINECLMLSREYPGKIFYGMIDRKGRTSVTGIEFVKRERLLDGEKIYCKAQDGYLIL